MHHRVEYDVYTKLNLYCYSRCHTLHSIPPQPTLSVLPTRGRPRPLIAIKGVVVLVDSNIRSPAILPLKPYRTAAWTLDVRILRLERAVVAVILLVTLARLKTLRLGICAVENLGLAVRLDDAAVGVDVGGLESDFSMARDWPAAWCGCGIRV